MLADYNQPLSCVCRYRHACKQHLAGWYATKPRIIQTLMTTLHAYNTARWCTSMKFPTRYCLAGTQRHIIEEPQTKYSHGREERWVRRWVCEGMARQKSVVQFLSVPVKSSLESQKNSKEKAMLRWSLSSSFLAGHCLISQGLGILDETWIWTLLVMLHSSYAWVIQWCTCGKDAERRAISLSHVCFIVPVQPH